MSQPGNINHHRRAPAVGCHHPRDKQKERPQIVIRFDRDTFDQVRALAVKEGTSFSEQVRRLIEWGLEVASDA